MITGDHVARCNLNIVEIAVWRVSVGQYHVLGTKGPGRTLAVSGSSLCATPVALFRDTHAAPSGRRRAQQIESLKRSNPAARAVTPDESTFDIGLRLRDGRVLTLRT